VGGALAIEVEMRREAVSALRRLGGRLEAQLEELRTIQAEALQAPPSERPRFVAEHARVRAEAEQSRWYLIVQREAMGVLNHEDVDRAYPLPPPLR
jgi:hypothetical protein